MIYYANDKYSGVLNAGYTVGQSTLYVSAVPDNVPTVIVAAKGTDNETVFEVTDKTTNSLTGVSRLRGANVDLDAQTPLTCLNNEEFINQFERATGAEVDTGTDPAKIVTPKAIADSKVVTEDGTQTLTNKRISKRVTSVTTSSSPTPDANSCDIYELTALAAGATFGAPTGTPTNGQGLIIRIKDNGSARSLSWNAIYRTIGVELPTTTVANKTTYVGLMYNQGANKWDAVAVSQQE